MRVILPLIIASLVSFLSCKSDKKEETKDKDSGAVTMDTIRVVPSSRDSSVIIDERVWTIIDTVPEENFRRAYQKFMMHDFKNAASEIRKGGNYIKSQADLTQDESKEKMEKAFKELDRISSKLEKNKKVTEKEMLKSFDQAQSGLADHYFENAIYAYEKDNNKKSGQWLYSAGQSIERAFDWTKEKTSEEYRKLAKDTKDFSQKLKEQGINKNDTLRQGLMSFRKRFRIANEKK